MKQGNPTKQGLSVIPHIIGLLGQRIYFYNRTRYYSEKLKIDQEKCSMCGKCMHICPMGNMSLKNNEIKTANQCTMCYRCINQCPNQAITLLGKQVVEQHTIKKYVD